MSSCTCPSTGAYSFIRVRSWFTTPEIYCRKTRVLFQRNTRILRHQLSGVVNQGRVLVREYNATVEWHVHLVI